MAKLNDIRAKFINYFKEHGHEEVKSSSLVPENDPTLMFTNSGMVQFKNVFTGDENREVARAVTSQKCVRAGGKHNDLDNVGYTARHHTFFEMLGNFSFGDYFKEKAIPLAWDLVTKEFELPKERLLVTVYHDDDEAAALWKSYAGLSDHRIIRIKSSDNFWSMGSTGPCGPCSEIFFDHGESIDGGPPGSTNEDGDRFVEIWNLVFMQFDQLDNGERKNLPTPSIDTGMGLERIAAILQGKHDNYDTDLFKALIEESAIRSNTEPDGFSKNHHRVITDHLRSASFLIADGVLPSSDGRGYVLRRILRRAMRHANLMNVSEPFIYKLVGKLVELMGLAFPEIRHSQKIIEDTIFLEEGKFISTLGKGMSLLESATATLDRGAVLDGNVAFKLYDTYGFPLDLTEDSLRGKGITVDIAAYEEEMRLQKARARSSWSGSGDSFADRNWLSIFDRNDKTDFLGYEKLSSEGLALALVKDSIEVESAKLGDTVQLLCNQTPFYGESGGQKGDTGSVTWVTGSGRVKNVFNIGGFIIHELVVEEGELLVSQPLKLSVCSENRKKIRSNHSATHLLHQALRNNLGDHIEQRGSLNGPDRLRFDFSHSSPVSKIELENVQNEVNELVRQNSKVITNILGLNQARELGARALFGEKYDNDVRVVSIGMQRRSGLGLSGDSYSLELCGGTHVDQTGEIGFFILVGESASSSGVRRIEALTGQAAIEFSSGMINIVTNLSSYLKSTPDTLSDRVNMLLSERKASKDEISRLKIKLSSISEGINSSGHSNESVDINDIKLIVRVVDDLPAKDIRSILDELKVNRSMAVVLVFSTSGEKVIIATGVTADLHDRISAVDIVRLASKACGGHGGGGRVDFAQSGGSNPTGISAALEEIKSYLSSN